MKLNMNAFFCIAILVCLAYQTQGDCSKFVSNVTDFVIGGDQNRALRTNKIQHCIRYIKSPLQEKFYKGILDQEIKSNLLFRSGWEKAQKIIMPSFGLSEEELRAVITYTLESPKVYSVFNRQTRDIGAANPNYQFKAMHYYLTMAIEKLSAQSLNDNSYKVYRGCTYPVVDAIEGQPFSFANFASTSTKESVANNFFQQSPDEKTLFVIESTKQGAKIKQFSQFPEEEEVLVPPCENFKGTKIIEESGIKKIYLESLAPDGNFKNSPF